MMLYGIPRIESIYHPFLSLSSTLIVIYTKQLHPFFYIDSKEHIKLKPKLHLDCIKSTKKSPPTGVNNAFDSRLV